MTERLGRAAFFALASFSVARWAGASLAISAAVGVAAGALISFSAREEMLSFTRVEGAMFICFALFLALDHVGDAPVWGGLSLLALLAGVVLLGVRLLQRRHEPV
jgi:hypothetical protein